MMLDWISQDPKPSASVLQGLFFGRVAPPREERREMQQHDARDRPPPRPDPPVLRLRHARARAAERAAGGGQLDPRAAAHAGAADGRDRAVRRAVLRGRQARQLRVPPPWPPDGSRRRRCGASARQREAKAARARASGWWATAAARCWRSRRSWSWCCWPAAGATRRRGERQLLPRGRRGAGAEGVRPDRAARAAGCELKDSRGSGVATHTTSPTSGSSTRTTRRRPAGTSRSRPTTAPTATRRPTSSSCTPSSTAA